METLYLEKFSYFRRCEPTILKIRFGFAYTRFQVQNKIAYIKIVLYTHSLERFLKKKYILFCYFIHFSFLARPTITVLSLY